jgi:acyl-[acyl carrier protein]--UDP-N-acetylglucosamine O-acyltransferase
MLLSDFSSAYFDVIKDGKFSRPFLMFDEPTEQGLLVMTLNRKYFRKACDDRHISAIIVTPEVIRGFNIRDINKGLAVTSYPEYMLYYVDNFLADNDPAYSGRGDKPTNIGDNCVISDKAVIHSFDVEIGSNCIIEENAIIREGVSIRDGTVIRAGAIIGDSEIQVVNGPNNKNVFVKVSGGVEIGRNCEIGYYTVVQRGMLATGKTRIGNNVAIGSKVDISHDVIVGDYVDIRDDSFVAGHTRIGESTHIAPRCTLSGAIKIGSNVNVTIGSNVVNDLADNSTVAGNWAIDKEKYVLWNTMRLMKLK